MYIQELKLALIAGKQNKGFCFNKILIDLWVDAAGIRQLIQFT